MLKSFLSACFGSAPGNRLLRVQPLTGSTATAPLECHDSLTATKRQPCLQYHEFPSRIQAQRDISGRVQMFSLFALRARNFLFYIFNHYAFLICLAIEHSWSIGLKLGEPKRIREGLNWRTVWKWSGPSHTEIVVSKDYLGTNLWVIFSPSE